MNNLTIVLSIIFLLILVILGAIYLRKGFLNKVNGEKMSVGVIGLGRMGEAIAFSFSR